MAGEMIHMLHGAIGSHLDWANTQECLQGKGVLTEAHNLYDYLKTSECSFDQFVKEFEQALVTTRKQCLLGYSLGGRLALHALLESPSLWEKAVIVSAHTGLPQQNENEREAREQADRKWAQMARDMNTPWSEFLTKWNQQGVLKAQTNQSLNWIDRLSLESVRGQIATSFESWSLGSQDDLLEKLSYLTVPILWIVGEEDQKFLEIAMKATNVLPYGELRVVKNAGHRVPWEQSNEFHSLISEWFDV